MIFLRLFIGLGWLRGIGKFFRKILRACSKRKGLLKEVEKLSKETTSTNLCPSCFDYWSNAEAEVRHFDPTPNATSTMTYHKPSVMKEVQTFIDNHTELYGAKKFDSNKPRMDLLSVDAMVAIANIMGMGAKKYGDQNWRQGFAYSRLYAACQRHLTSWWNGDNLDDESGKSHLHHAACCLMMLIEHEIRNLGQDDRYYKEPLHENKKTSRRGKS